MELERGGTAEDLGHAPSPIRGFREGSRAEEGTHAILATLRQADILGVSNR